MKTIYMPKEATKVKCDHYRSAYTRMVNKSAYRRGQVVECEHGQRFIASTGGYDSYWSMRRLRPWRITWWKIPKQVSA